MHKAISSLFLILLMIFNGCATTKLTQKQLQLIENADYGEYPTDYEKIVKDYFSRFLFDPYSAVYRIGQPYKGYLGKPPILGGGPDKFGYLVDVSVNAKNRYGGYVGERQYSVLILNGQVIGQYPTFFQEELLRGY